MDHCSIGPQNTDEILSLRLNPCFPGVRGGLQVKADTAVNSSCKKTRLLAIEAIFDCP